MSRRQAREAALQALFQLDLNHGDEADQEEMYESLAIDTALAEGEAMNAHDRAFVKALVHGTRQHLAEIDAEIAHASREWKVERMAVVDRNLTRMATYEMQFAPEKLTPNIAINEAVELAKKYGTDESSRYVNGILGAIMKNVQ
ncbi:transcription antitermination factor NusB [Mitsuokella sp.]|uniref:transcription antitermination factor NusB n=1 Tax=Mitsuokella TaxID=52225 RepID=UPI0029E0D8CC|nr:transcription antitermination factor NusB [Mitsuokella sp.]MDD6383308.1 transcription antitermination factor NusB [Selenomonadaceae bacterium]MDY4475609.1 transcription antitermination factor NusB [Mitsuokella sp.]